MHFGKEASFEVQSARTPPKRAEPVAVDLPAQRAVPSPSSPSSPALLEMKPFGKHTGLPLPFILPLVPACLRLGEQSGVHYNMWKAAHGRSDI